MSWIGNGGVKYVSDDGKTTLTLPFPDIRTADLSHPGVIRLETYDVLKRKPTGRRVYKFRLAAGPTTKAWPATSKHAWPAR